MGEGIGARVTVSISAAKMLNEFKIKRHRESYATPDAIFAVQIEAPIYARSIRPLPSKDWHFSTALQREKAVRSRTTAITP